MTHSCFASNAEMFLIDLLPTGGDKGGDAPGQDHQVSDTVPGRLIIDLDSFWRHQGGEGELGVWSEDALFGLATYWVDDFKQVI